MPDRKELKYLLDMIHSAVAIQSYVSGVTEEAFYQNSMRIDAVSRRFEIIGEAAARISQETRRQIP